MIYETNVAESESVDNRWLHDSSLTETSLFLNRTYVTLKGEEKLYVAARYIGDHNLTFL